MKPGSLVELVTDLHPEKLPVQLKPYIKALPVKNKVYTVRAFGNCPDEGVIVYIEEVYIGYNPYSRREFGISPEGYRELEIPPSIEQEIANIIEDDVLVLEPHHLN